MINLEYGKRKELHVQRNLSARGYEITLVQRDRDGRHVTMMSEIVMVEIDEGLIYPQSPLVLREEEAQQLIDELWRAGLRPTDGAGTAGAMARADEHIKDLRAIAYKLLEINT